MAKRAEQLEFLWSEESVVSPGPPPARPDRVAETPAPMPEPRPIDLRAQELYTCLSQRFDGPLHLTITDNSSTMMSLRRGRNGLVRLRLHHMFLDAPPKVRAALADWLNRPRARKAGDAIDLFIRERRHLIKPAQARQEKLRTQGHRHDLAQLYKEVNRNFFDNKVNAAITWGRMPARLNKRRRSIRFGSYYPEQRLIRIHPLLDSEEVPRFFVRYIVFHEMLHALLGIAEGVNGRRAVHPPEFRTIEQGFPDYEKACKWIDNPRNMRRLLNPRRKA